MLVSTHSPGGSIHAATQFYSRSRDRRRHRLGFARAQGLQRRRGPAQTYPNQVPFVSGPEVSGLTAEDIQTLFAINPAYTAQDQAATYPQSVASGDPQPTGIVLWTRIAPTAMGAPSAGNIAWQIASDSGFTSILVQGVATVDPAADNTVKLPISNPVLAPYNVYYYRFLYNEVPSRTGRFKTLPARHRGTGATQDRLRRLPGLQQRILHGSQLPGARRRRVHRASRRLHI